MSSKVTVIAISSVNLMFVLLTIVACMHVIWKFILKTGIHKKFVNMFYGIALLILLSSLFMIIAVYLEIDGIYQSERIYKDEAIPLSLLSVSNSIHSVCYIGMLILQICTIVQITAGLRMTYYRNQPEKHSSVIRLLYVTYTLCILCVIITALVEVLSLTENLTGSTMLLFYISLLPVMFVIYLYSLCVLFRYMNTEQNPALRPEHSKMSWQTFYFCLSLVTFFTVHLLVYLDKVRTFYNVFLVLWGCNFVIDIMPMWYVIYCHQRSFMRMKYDFDMYNKNSA